GLSWLGWGVTAPAVSWGGMLRAAYEQMRSAPYLVYPPCVAIFGTVVACHLAGTWLRRRLDPVGAR
ncbi:MAG TPA: ABC transporter permease, partial [Phycisphaerae bacterium]|nr:ABC transporter permease [Phycisphaerae bacterium]